MHSYFTIALLSLAPHTHWEDSYSHAQVSAINQQKPLAVVFGPGVNGWNKVVRAEGPSLQAHRLLADHYVCVFLDTETDIGRRWAQRFGIDGKVGMIIGDRTGNTQAFWHQGDMTNANMVHYLTKYSDPRVVVNETETIPVAAPAYQSSYSSRPVNC